MEEIIVGNYYKHKRTNTVYEVYYITKMKHPDNGEWIDCVIYRSMKDLNIWVRSLNSFKEHFDALT